MTPEVLQHDWLSLRCWLVRCVMPSAAVLLVILALLNAMNDNARALDHKALLAAFFAVYFTLVRGGHMLMIRSLHRELLRKYEDDYRARLARFDRAGMKRRNIGFTLTRIKREFIDAQNSKANQFRR